MISRFFISFENSSSDCYQRFGQTFSGFLITAIGKTCRVTVGGGWQEVAVTRKKKIASLFFFIVLLPLTLGLSLLGMTSLYFSHTHLKNYQELKEQKENLLSLVPQETKKPISIAYEQDERDHALSSPLAGEKEELVLPPFSLDEKAIKKKYQGEGGRDYKKITRATLFL